MHHIARTAPVVGTTRPHSPAAALLAVVVAAVLAVLGLVTPPPGAPSTGTGTSGHATAADHLRYDGTRAAADHLLAGGTRAADHLRSGGTRAADPLRYAETHADDGCDAARVVRAATRHEQTHGEHPGPRGHSGTCDRSTHATPFLFPHPHGPPTLRMPVPQPHAAQDQGRAPPVFSGT
ncbi:hypothetical protein ABTX60_30130 [Streptomyces sp. NPDC126510]|uniref:hypothetical protein n=1 Tax=Streptomyces sp. NPDC126510 TaxID=3155317 RepID=UPI00332ED857